MAKLGWEKKDFKLAIPDYLKSKGWVPIGYIYSMYGSIPRVVMEAVGELESEGIIEVNKKRQEIHLK